MVQPDHPGARRVVGKMAPDRITDHFAELVNVFGLCEDGFTHGSGAVTTFGIFLNNKNDLIHSRSHSRENIL
jgi:hypothetical protein